MDYRYGSHTVFQIEYHFVWVTKYRYEMLTGDVAERVRALVRRPDAGEHAAVLRGNLDGRRRSRAALGVSEKRKIDNVD